MQADTKQCRKCSETKPITDFELRKDRGKCRREAQCKVCRQAQRNAYNKTEKGRAVLRESRRRYRAKHPECETYSHLKSHAKDAEHFSARRNRHLKIYKLSKQLPKAPREVVAAIVDTRHSIYQAKKVLAQIDKKEK